MKNKNTAAIEYPLITKDSKGRVVHGKYSWGFEYWNEYDEKNNVIHSKDSDEFEAWYEYDEKNNVIHSKDSDGFEAWYDSEGNEIPNPSL
jgi:YD repeat-containing protein